MAEYNLENSYKCPICLELCQDLKTLNCQHSFCVCCLEDWMQKKGKLECPNCRQVQPINEGGLSELTSKSDGVKTAEHLLNLGNRKCYCGKDSAEFYCQECSQCVCSFCKHSHDFLPALKNHTLEPINTNRPTEEPEPMCPQHEKNLEYYCNICKTPICQKCTVTDHSKDEGKHEPIRASDAFSDFKLTANALMARADIHKHKIKVGINTCVANASELSNTKFFLIKDINSTVEEIVKFVREIGKALGGKLNDVCEAKREKSNSQIDELKSSMSKVEEKQHYIAQLLKSTEATALQTCQQALMELQETMVVLPETEPRDDGNVYFFSIKDQILNALKAKGIGCVTEKSDANIFEIVPGYPRSLTFNQPFHVTLAKKFKCEVDTKDLQANWTFSNKSQICKAEQVNERKYIVSPPYFDRFISSLKLDVTFCNTSIKGSPITIFFESVNTTRTLVDNICQSIDTTNEKGISELFWSLNGYFLVCCNTNIIYKLTNSGAYMSKLILSPKSMISGICELKSKNIIFWDWGNGNITICKQDGQVIKTIPTGMGSQSLPSGIGVNEVLHILFVADRTANCVHVFDMESNIKVKTIGSKGCLEGQMNGLYDIAITKKGNLIVADNSRIQLFDKEGQFMKILIGGGEKDGMVKEPSRVVVDYDDNIIVASKGKIQLFNSQGKFVRVLTVNNSSSRKKEVTYVVTLFSHYPRSLALAELNSTKIEIVYY